ncbi:NAD(P)/FAD-dependent oxidoreductase, partial [Undibacterium sp.]|uniref:NAD(P)/FAD-dependent oxidoreductase n=1 Tax=Undibacterium sp. TaxID=1914977 RepID=UPI002BC8917E
MNQQSGEKLHKITIVGGGAGGLELAVRLGKKLGKKHKALITLVDASRTHLWKPLLHQVAAGTLDSHADEREYFALARANHFNFRFGRMDGLNREKKEIYLASAYDDDGSELLPRQTVEYDTLVMALGSQTNDFGTPGVQENSIMLDTPVAAERFHQRLINFCLKAQAESRARGEGRFTVTIIGGGATGVELAAELREASSLHAQYGLRHIDAARDVRIRILEGAPRLLAPLAENVSAAATRLLKQRHVEVNTACRVVRIDSNTVSDADGNVYPSDLCVWAAGIKAPPLLAQVGLPVTRSGQVTVDGRLRVEGV